MDQHWDPKPGCARFFGLARNRKTSSNYRFDKENRQTLEVSIQVKLDFFPRDRGGNKKNIWNHRLAEHLINWAIFSFNPQLSHRICSHLPNIIEMEVSSQDKPQPWKLCDLFWLVRFSSFFSLPTSLSLRHCILHCITRSPFLCSSPHRPVKPSSIAARPPLMHYKRFQRQKDA